MALLDVASGRFGVVGGFPGPPRSAAFCETADALVSVGAFRIAAWDLAAPSFDNQRAGALETGQTGLAAVVEVAVLPRRGLAAAAYANGRIVAAVLGAREELILQTTGRKPGALVVGAGQTKPRRGCGRKRTAAVVVRRLVQIAGGKQRSLLRAPRGDRARDDRHECQGFRDGALVLAARWLAESKSGAPGDALSY